LDRRPRFGGRSGPINAADLRRSRAVLDDAMAEIEKVNPGLKGVLPKDYNRPALDKVMLGELIDLVSGIATGEPGDKAKDLLGRVYEYFLGGFAGSEGKRGGEFYPPDLQDAAVQNVLQQAEALSADWAA
jgi:type I restriction-modification system DNA methylase subunit